MATAIELSSDRPRRGVDLPPNLSAMANNGEIDIRGFLRLVYRRKWMLVTVMTLSIGTAVLWISQATPRYTADVVIVVEARPSSIVSVNEPGQVSIADDATKVNTEVAVLKSRDLAMRVIEDLDLATDPEFAPDTAKDGGRLAAAMVDQPSQADLSPSTAFLAMLSEHVSTAIDTVSRLLVDARRGLEEFASRSEEPAALEEAVDPSATQDAEAREAAALLNRFLKRLSVKPSEGSRLITIEFTSIDPTKAAMIANKLIGAYMERQLETKSEGARRAAEWLELRLAELGDTVRSLDQDVNSQRVETGADNVDVIMQRLARFNELLVGAQANSAAARSRYEKVRAVLEAGGNSEAFANVTTSPSIQDLRLQQAQLKAELSHLLSTYGDRHPKVASLRAQFGQAEREMYREIDNILTGVRNEMEIAEANEAALRNGLEAVTDEMTQLHASEAEIDQLAERLQANRDLYRNLLERYTEAVALRDNQQPDARVISRAQVPLDPSYPNVAKVIGLAFVAAAALAALTLLLAERLRHKLDSVEDLERHVRLPILGVIPELPRLNRKASVPLDYMQQRPLSEFASALQRLRALLMLANGREMPRTVLVTSGSSGEGKSTIAMSLGIACVLSGERVLLIDCNVARPQLHRMLGVHNRLGLMDILSGKVSPEEAITHASSCPLSVLTIGSASEGTTDLLHSRRMESMLARLKHSYDLIILDSAPLHEVPNALMLGGLVEKTVLITRRDWTTQRQASSVAYQLGLSGADIAGSVFNRSVSANERSV